MGLVENYYGKYFTAATAKRVLDIDTIFRGCDEADGEAERILDISEKIKKEASLLDTALSVDGKNLSETLQECLSSIECIKNQINSCTSSIKTRTEAAYNKIQANYNAIAEAKDKELSIEASKK